MLWVVFMTITYKSCYYLFILQPERSTLVELFCFVGERIGLKVLVFSRAGLEKSQVNVLFVVFWFSEFSFSS